MQSKAKTVAEYLASLPADRRAALSAVRAVILKNLDKGYEEGMQYGMIGYYIPHSIYPPGYHCDPKQPLPFCCLASQKNYMSLYLMCVYGSPTRETHFRSEWARTGKKLDMGKSCIRFKKLDDLALDVIADAIRGAKVRNVIDFYETAILSMNKRKSAAASRSSSKSKPAPTKRTAAGPAARKSRPKSKSTR